MSEDSEDCDDCDEEQDLHGSISVIHIKEKTYLCRWGEENDSCRIECKALNLPRSAPTRRDSDPNRRDSVPPLPAQKHKEASEKSGIQLGSVSLVPVVVVADGATPQETSGISFAQVLEGMPVHKVKVVFCIRREGCGSCRMNGMELAQLRQTLDFEMMGILKEPVTQQQAENEVAKKALFDFYTQYFPFPLYRDTKWDVYKFLGDRKITKATLATRTPKLFRLYAQKKIENVLFDGGRDVYTQGGILIFDGQSKLRYVYYDRYGDELDIDALKLAIQDSQRSASKLGMASKLPTRRRP